VNRAAVMLSKKKIQNNRIKSSEIDVIDLYMDLGRPEFGRYLLSGQIRNRSANNCTLNSITLLVNLLEKEPPDTVGEQTVEIRVEVPPHQTRAISQTVYFPNLPQLKQPWWIYSVSEIRGSKGLISPDNPFVKYFDPDKYLRELTPTPSPKRDIFDDLAEEAEAKKKHGTAKPGDVIETVDPKTGKRRKIDLSKLPDQPAVTPTPSPTP
jgi:hypothetical protein